MEEKKMMFSNMDLQAMIIPLFLEQLLVMLVGIADTLVVSYAGEAAVSGVSLVNQFNTIFIYLFTALASGGAVVLSQYIGRKESENAGISASQLLMFGTVFSVLIAVLVLIGNRGMLRLLFGKVDDSVMEACVTYLRISAYSYPALAIYNAGAAVYRSLGKTNVTMYISVVSNIINVIGNVIGVFVLHGGVAGVAWPSLIARTFSAVVITFLCFGKKREVVYKASWIFKWDTTCLKRILNVAIPNGVENGIFQLVKVALSSIVALFGTYQIAANGVAQSIWSLAALAGVAMGPAFITVVGQCMGNKDIQAADYYLKKLSRITLLLSSGWNLFIFILTPFFLRFYALEAGTKQLVIWLVLIHNVFNAVAFPYSGALSNGLRAAGDVKFTMYVSVISTIAGRLFLSFLLGIVFQMGVIGIALAMVADWVIRAVIFIWRQKSGKWKEFQVI
ncbi:MATE family efflux transporter [Parablautia muri]|uniref:Probable multidrug resistance protein NorM n=1 Tax=Parablautia muri TaxID=2320879 RepID=A0A9X5BHS2_9FIRM|nr:MATE family efflux transporter [Parablautia muri]NBJ94320.1 MATE family efflux transporter [Parablautia muri]